MRTEDPTRIEIQKSADGQRISGIARHGMVPFDAPLMSYIEAGLWVGGYVEGAELPRKIKHVVSLYPWGVYRYHDEVESVLRVVAYDDGVPEENQIIPIAEYVRTRMFLNQDVLVHCQAGLNRSPLVAASALCIAGKEPREAIEVIRSERDRAVLCNKEFEKWILESF